MTTRVFLVDDQSLVRAGFRMVLDAQPDMEVVGEAPDGQSAVDQLRAIAADVVLMDIRMPRLDGIEATRELLGRESHPGGGEPKVVVLTTFDMDEYVYAALEAGASGFLLKDAGPEELLAAIRAVASGDAVVAPSTTKRLLERFVPTLAADTEESEVASPAEQQAYLREVLTEREHEVFVAVARGLSNTEIAQELFVAEATVKTHIGRLLFKLGCRDRVQLVITAYEAGVAGQAGPAA
ncbi:two component transcriptional regulator, LuxR family [Kytococcus aerolatus]|uniref:Two component transcriptional regulator, LuxR family n=1 Tax=Kytococcus aerolatus TaxID=592308 RepID=A0A212U5D4_9MICO|nr:response regulator transcription factor [Kytococcus aerolatus]SNC73468.1 two component transcriptional regulator, LuxR family [Kytococcus aerolatus]